MLCCVGNSEIDAELARQIAHGTVDPVTREPYAPELLGALAAVPVPSSTTPPLRTGTPRSHDITQFFAAADATAPAAPEEPATATGTATGTTEQEPVVAADEDTAVRRRLDYVVLSRFFALPPPEQLARLCPCEVVCRGTPGVEGCEEEDEDDGLDEQTPCKRTRAELDALPSFSYTEDEDEEEVEEEDGEDILNFGDEEKDAVGNAPPAAAAAAVYTGTPDAEDAGKGHEEHEEETAQGPPPQDRALALDSLDMFLCD